MACYEIRLKAAQSTKARLVGSSRLCFYLQTVSIILPTSISPGVRSGVLQAFGLSLKRTNIFIKEVWARQQIDTVAPLLNKTNLPIW